MMQNYKAPALRGLERGPVHRKAAGLIPDQGAHLGCGFNSPSRCVQEVTKLCFSLISMFLSVSPSRSKNQ